MSRRAAALALALALLAPVAAATPVSGRPSRPAATSGATAGITLLDQTAFVVQGGLFSARFRVTGAPPDATVRLAMHDRVVSRGEFATTVAGDSLRAVRFRTTAVPLASVRRTGGAARLSMRLARNDDAGDTDTDRFPVTREGTYPVEIEVLDAAGAVAADLLTFLVLLPPSTDNSPALSVALVHDIGLRLALDPAGTFALPRRSAAVVDAIAEVLDDHDHLRMTFAPRGETIDALLQGGGDVGEAAVRTLRRAVEDQQLLSRPYTEVDVDAMAQRGLADEVRRSLAAGDAAVADALDAEPSPTAWLAGPTLGDASLRAVVPTGSSRVVVAPGGIAPLAPAALDPTRWFHVLGPSGPLEAVEADAALTTRLTGADESALEAQRFLAELASIWFERPAIDRGVVVVVPTRPRVAAVLDRVLDGLAANRILEPVTLDEFFTAVDPMEGDDGVTLVRALTPTTPADVGDLAARLDDVRRGLASYDAMVGAADPTAALLERLVLAAATAGLTDVARREYLDRVAGIVTRTAGAVTTSRRATITLTARTGTIPVTVRNEAGRPVRVRIALDSDKLEFRDGETIDVTLTERTTRVDVRVRTLTSGAFPLDIVVTSPDGAIRLAEARYTVRSTAVSGVGLFLSLGAGVFLLLWWARHWRDARRSRRLVPAEARHLRREPTEGSA